MCGEYQLLKVVWDRIEICGEVWPPSQKEEWGVLEVEKEEWGVLEVEKEEWGVLEI